jgi:hypothetical protein
MRQIIGLGALAAAAVLTMAVSAQAQRGPQIVLYQEDNFRGNQYAVNGPEDRIRFDDRASSVRVLSGTWELCDDDHFRGRCITVDRDVPKLDRMGMDDRISSVRPIQNRRDDDDRRRRQR